MILARKADLTVDVQKIISFFNDNNINENIEKEQILYLLEENNRIKGYCKISMNDLKWILESIFIDEDSRGEDLGDGLLRATFNFCFRRGISEIYYPDKNEYLLKKGFTEIIREDKADMELLCNLELFFNKGCKCKRS